MYLAVFGERSLPEWWRARKERRIQDESAQGSSNTSAVADPSEKVITQVDWDSIIAAVDTFVSSNPKKYDLIV